MLNRGCWELLSTLPVLALAVFFLFAFSSLTLTLLRTAFFIFGTLLPVFVGAPLTLLCLFRRFEWFFNILSFVFLMAFRSDFWTRPLLLSITFVVLTASPSMPVIFFGVYPCSSFRLKHPWLFIDITFFIKGVVRSPRSLANFSYFTFYGEFVEILYLRPNKIQLVCFKVFESDGVVFLSFFLFVSVAGPARLSSTHQGVKLAAQPPCRARI